MPLDSYFKGAQVSPMLATTNNFYEGGGDRGYFFLYSAIAADRNHTQIFKAFPSDSHPSLCTLLCPYIDSAKLRTAPYHQAWGKFFKFFSSKPVRATLSYVSVLYDYTGM